MNHLEHHGILGQKWGIRRYQNPDGSLTPRGRAHLEKQDSKWVRKNSQKVYKNAYKASRKELNYYVKRELDPKYYGQKKGAYYANEYNRKLAELMNKNASDIPSPSGKVIRFVAMRGTIGVHTALATPGYDMSSVRTGVYSDGRVAYKKDELEFRHSDILVHHGILGQKWGVRRYQNKDGSLTGAGKKRYSEEKLRKIKERDIKRYNNSRADTGYTLDRKEMLRISNNQIALNSALSALSLVGLNPVGSVAFAVSAVQASKAKQKINGAVADREATKKDANGIPLKKRKMTSDEDLSKVNPLYNTHTPKATSNCALCTATYDMRRRGYEVVANYTKAGMTNKDMLKWYPTAEIKVVSEKNVKASAAKVSQEILEQGNGARGTLNVRWKAGGGHSMIYEVENGNVVIKDAQNGKTYGNLNGEKLIKPINKAMPYITYIRYDNVDFDPKEISRCIT